MLVTAAVLVSDGRVLCMQRGSSRYAYLQNKYEFPGGKVENGESPEQCLRRELGEELGLALQPGDMRYWCTVHYDYPDFDIDLCVFVCRMPLEHFELREHTSFCWLPPQQLVSLAWAPADYQLLPQLTEQLVAWTHAD